MIDKTAQKIAAGILVAVVILIGLAALGNILVALTTSRQ